MIPKILSTKRPRSDSQNPLVRYQDSITKLPTNDTRQDARMVETERVRPAIAPENLGSVDPEPVAEGMEEAMVGDGGGPLAPSIARAVDEREAKPTEGGEDRKTE